MNPFFNKNNGGNNSTNIPDFSALTNNPLFRMMQGKGLSYEQMVRSICQQRGIDVNQVLEQAKLLQGNNK